MTSRAISRLCSRVIFHHGSRAAISAEVLEDRSGCVSLDHLQLVNVALVCGLQTVEAYSNNLIITGAY